MIRENAGPVHATDPRRQLAHPDAEPLNGAPKAPDPATPPRPGTTHPIATPESTIMGHLILYSLGPVQDFIATARRCQDLWFGSWLLSHLSAAAARTVTEHGGVDAVIVPGKLTDGAAVANELYALSPDLDSAKAWAAACGRAIAAELDALCDEFFARVPADGFYRETALAQVRALIETAWVAVPCAPSDYQIARRRAKGLLAARKSTRAFPPVPWHGGESAGVPKSSLDGSRESVIAEAIYDDVRTGRKTTEWLMKHYRARPAERLSGVDLLKRLGQEVDATGDPRGRPAFHSTSHISSAPLRTRIARLGAVATQQVDRWLEDLQNNAVDLSRFTIRAGHHDTAARSHDGQAFIIPRTLQGSTHHGGVGLDGYVLYEDRLHDLLEQSSTGGVDEDRLAVLRNTLKGVLGALGWSRPVQPYYAFVLADGDHMGRAIDGLGTPREHKAFSEHLERWAQGCRDTIEGALGTLIYSGGDDVLALLPLHTALSCARELATSFSEAMKDAFKKVPQGNRPDSLPTLSVGLAIAHHMVPMADALALARRAEKDAKTLRNAIAIRVAKRSGGELAVKGSWSEVSPLDERIPTWGRLFSGEQLPDKAAFAMEEAVATIVGDPALDASTVAPQTVRALARRALLRRRGDRGERELDEKVAEMLEARFRESDPAEAVAALSAELQIARLFLDAYEEAWSSAPAHLTEAP